LGKEMAMKRWNVALILVTFSLAVPVASYPASLSLYDDFSGDRIDAARWQNLEMVREIRGGKLVSSLRATGVPGSVSNTSQLANAAGIQSLQADVRLLEYTPPPGGGARMRVAGYFYNDGTTGTGATGDVAVQLYLRGTNAGVDICYDGFRCTNADCSMSTTLFPVTTVKSAALGEMHTLAIGWNGEVFTFTVDGVPTVVDPRPIVPVGSPNPRTPEKKFGARLLFGGPGGTGSVSGDYDNVYVNGSLYDDFDGVSPNSGPRLDPAKWIDLEYVQEIQSGRLVSKVAHTGGSGTSANNRLRPVNTRLVTALQWDETVTALESTGTDVMTRLNAVFYNDGTSTGPSDARGDINASIRIHSNNGGPLTVLFLVTRCVDAPCNTDAAFFSDSFATVNVGETHTLFLNWDGSVFTYGVQTLGITKTFDPRPYYAVAKPPVSIYKDIRTRVSINTANAYGYIATTVDNIHVNSEALSLPRLAPAFRQAVTGDVVSAGVGLRGTGTGTITLAGIPSGATAQKAFLYWATLGGNGTFTSPTLNGTPVSGTLIGQSDDPLPGIFQAFAYRADVTSLVTGNGTYTIADLPAGPLPPANLTVNDSEGATLVAIYSQLGAPARVITINDGAVTLIGGLVQAHSTALKGFVTATPPTGARLTFVMGDGQSSTPEYAGINTNLLAMNQFSGSDGAYWDTRTYDVSSVLAAGAAKADAVVSTASDSLVWVATILSVPGRLHTDAVGLFRPSEGTFYLDANASGIWDGCGTDRCLQIGMLNDIPLVGDWNGSETSKVGSFRPSDGTFYLDYNGSGTWEGCGTDRCLQIGMNGDIPLVGDWNGRGTSKVGVFRPADGTFYLDYNGSGTWEGCGTDRCLQIGLNGDIPLIGDWNGSGTSKVGAFRPADGTFYLDYNGSGTWEGCGVDRCLQIGMLNDTPLVGDWNGSGTAKVGAFRPSDGTFYLDYNGSGTWEGCGTDRCLQIGLSGDTPLVGKW
jgi:hypothetical protein